MVTDLNAVIVLVAVVSELDLVSNHVGEVFFSLLTRGGSQTLRWDVGIYYLNTNLLILFALGIFFNTTLVYCISLNKPTYSSNIILKNIELSMH